MRMHVTAGVVLTLLTFTAPVSADQIVFNTSDAQFDPGVDNQGWWSATRSNVDWNASYFVGLACDTAACTTIHDNRNFFTFDLRSLTGTVNSATLELRRTRSQSASATFTLFDVSTDPMTLNNNTGRNAAIFDDLGTGRGYGVFRVTNGLPDDVLRFPLNAAAIADIQASAGGFFSIGGAIFGGGWLFGGGEIGNGGSGIQRLVIASENTAPVPEPGSMLLVGSALGLCARRLRRWGQNLRLWSAKNSVRTNSRRIESD